MEERLQDAMKLRDFYRDVGRDEDAEDMDRAIAQGLERLEERKDRSFACIHGRSRQRRTACKPVDH